MYWCLAPDGRRWWQASFGCIFWDFPAQAWQRCSMAAAYYLRLWHWRKRGRIAAERRKASGRHPPYAKYWKILYIWEIWCREKRRKSVISRKKAAHAPKSSGRWWKIPMYHWFQRNCLGQSKRKWQKTERHRKNSGEIWKTGFSAIFLKIKPSGWL